MPWIAGAVAGGAALNYISAGNAADKQAEGTDRAVAATERQSNQARGDLAPYRQAGQAALTRLQKLLGLGDNGPDQSDPRYKAIYDDLYKNANAEHISRYGIPLAATPDSTGLNAQTDELNRQARYQFDQLYPGASAETAANGDYGSLTRKFAASDLDTDPVYQSGLKFGLDEGTKAIERRAAAGGGYDSGGTLKALTRFGNDYGSTKAGESYGRFSSDQDRLFGKLAGVSGMGSGATTVGVGAGTSAGSNLSSLYSGEGNALGASEIAKGNAVSGALNGYMNYNLLSQLTGGGQRSATPALRASYDPSQYAG